MMRSMLPRLVRPSLAKAPTAVTVTIGNRFASSSTAPVFDWQDPLASKTLLTEEELAISETAERYCQEQLLPRVLQAYRDENYDTKILEEMGELGLLGATIEGARYGIALGVMGALEDCIARARTYALERKQFKGNPLARYQLVQKKLADASTDAAYGTLAAIQVGRLKDEGKATPDMISMVKRQNCDRALQNARVLQEIFGGNAVSDEYAIGRHVANLFVTQTYEGQSDIHSLILGRAITGVQAFV
ncbi:hypothetical protein D7B24_004577 [Verticillium nonalfalfae]|uniref:Acyl-CoA dehydrogenase/oxidase C-terminal domain-containing protein n=1 Tax=Verticillium nonalfalfae TaxID=1051616 RepID=A0A3M9YEB6_9PEZI|nr:uncharacterized protein D7B24_004577 [Verticillium nonalfalfae]RNJ58495.1 hypothetical protein D7B24_004577 [Verticillium nonalfalfae]